MQQFRLKESEYYQNCKGYPRFISIYCAKCNHPILLYQKDGPGILKRLYLDRITAPEELSKYQLLNIKKVPDLKCMECNHIIGSSTIYKKMNREAFLLNKGSFKQKPSDGHFPPND